MAREDYLFSEYELSTVIRGHQAKLLQEIDSIDPDQLLKTSPGDWATYFEEKFKIAIPEVHRDRAHVDQSEAQIDVSRDPRRALFIDREGPVYVRGTKVTLTVPFSGDPNIFKCRASTYTTAPPMAQVHGGEILIVMHVLDEDGEQVRQRLEGTLAEIERYLGYARADVGGSNSAIRQQVGERVEARRQKILRDRSLVESLGFPLKRRFDVPPTFVVPAIRRTPPIPPVSPKGEAFAPDPTISPEEYDNILAIISGMAQVLEKSPAAFKNLHEEEIRTHFLVQLNGQYQGTATGETFNCQGKTDILIKHEGKNIFVAECKFWLGPKKFLETIDQLLSYTTWRDTKTAILIFNRKKNFSTVLQSIRETAPSHLSFKRAIPSTSETCFRYVFHHPNDKNREIIVGVLAFEVPA